MKAARYSGFMCTFLYICIKLKQLPSQYCCYRLHSLPAVWLYILSLHYYCILLYKSLTLHNPSKQLHIIPISYYTVARYIITPDTRNMIMYPHHAVETMQTCDPSEILKQESPIWQSPKHEQLRIRKWASLKSTLLCIPIWTVIVATTNIHTHYSWHTQLAHLLHSVSYRLYELFQIVYFLS